MIKALTSALAATLLVSFAQVSQAHVSPKDEEMLGPFEGMIKLMRRKSDKFPCCNGDDAYANVPVRVVTGSDNLLHYQVQIDKDLNGTLFKDGPRWVDVPDHTVLEEDYALAFCRKLKEEEPDSPDAKTCEMPSFAVVWMRPKENMPHMPFMGGDHYRKDNVFCFKPASDLK